MVHSGDLLTYTVNFTVAGNAAQNVVVTDTLPPGLSFGSFLSTPAGGSSSFASPNLSWTIPSLSAGSYQLIYTAKVASLLAGGTILTNGVVGSFAGGPALTDSKSVTVIGDFTVRVGVYNEAGELVKQIFVKQFSQAIQDITLMTDKVISSLNDKIDIVYQGQVIGTWDGTNTAGEPVVNGKYHIKVDNVDPMGTVMTTTQEAVVSRTLYKEEVVIYNEAGEAVRHLYSYVDDPGKAGLVDVRLSASVIRPGGTGNGIPTQLVVTLSTGASVVWDGRSDAGKVVSTGKYIVEAHSVDGQGGETQITRMVMVEGGDGEKGAGTVQVSSNLLDATTTQAVFQSSLTGQKLKVRVYTVAGELVADLLEGTNPTWNTSGLASGLYLAVVQIKDAQGLLASRVLKLVVRK
jgi:uncharacterized repeat protein (TIGR01451 family)